MKKVFLLCALVCAGQMYGMEPLYPEKQDYMAMLPKEIKGHIVFALAQSDTIEEVVNAIHSLTETSKEFNAIINEPITIRTIIRILVQKFNAPSEYIAQQLGTPGSKYYIQLSNSLTVSFWQQNFDWAENLLYTGADIDFQPVDTYPMFCTTGGTLNLLSALGWIIYMKARIINTEESLSALEKALSLLPAEERTSNDEENIKNHQLGIKNYQEELQKTISNLQNLVQENKNIFKNDKEFKYFISKINEEKFQEAFTIIKPKEVVSYNHGITAYYAIGETDICVIGANLSIVMYAIAANQPALLEWLFKHNANLDLFMGTGNTALLMAINLGKKEMIELLIKNGANVNQKNISKAKKEEIRENDPFLISIDKQRAKMPYALLDNDTLTSIFEIGLTISEETPLIQLLFSGHFADQELYNLIKLFLDNGADPNIPASNGDTPLIILTAMQVEGSANIMKLLLDYGADPSIKNDEGMTALDYMKSKKTENDQEQEENEAEEEDPEKETKIQLLENAMKKQQKK